MKSFSKVFKFELSNYFQNKIYVITTVLVTLIFAILMCIPTIINIFNDDASHTPEPGTGDDIQYNTDVGYSDTYALFDPLGLVTDFSDFEMIFNAYWINVSNEDEIETMLKNDEIAGGFSLISPTEARLFVAESGMYESRDTMFREAFLSLYRTNALKELGIDASVTDPYYNMSMNIETVALEKDGFAEYIYAYVLLFILYFLILMYGNMIATSVTTEKSSRTIEILVTSTSTNALLTGKVIAGTVASVIQAGIIIGGTLLSYTVNKTSWKELISFNFDIPVNLIAAFAIFGILAYIFYAFMYGMLGALVSKTEDINKSTGPIQMIFIAGFLISIYSTSVPDSIWMKIMSYLPFTSCNAMVLRIAIGNVSIVEIIISVLILAASNAGIAVLSSKIYRMTTLMYGNPIKLSNALKFLKKDNT